jgi:hypothetical protein
MKKKMTFLIIAIITMGIISAQQLLKNSFTAGLAVGEKIEKNTYNSTDDPVVINQWNLWHLDISDGITEVDITASPIAAAPLSYGGYIESDNSIALENIPSGVRMTTYSLDEANGNAYPASTSPYYLSFILNPNSTETSATIANQAGVIAFNGSANGQFLRGVFTIFKQTDTAFRIGLSGIYGGTPKSLGVWYQFGAPNLFIIKFDAVNNTMWIWANPTTEVLSSTTENIGAAKMRFDFETESRLSVIRSISIFQRNDLKATIGGLRFARSWEGIVKNDVGSGVNPNIHHKKIIKEQYFSLSGQEIIEPVDKQIYIKKYTFDDGEIISEKIVYTK